MEGLDVNQQYTIRLAYAVPPGKQRSGSHPYPGTHVVRTESTAESAAAAGEAVRKLLERFDRGEVDVLSIEVCPERWTIREPTQGGPKRARRKPAAR